MNHAGGTFRIAVRKFGPFESAIQKQWDRFEQKEKTGLELSAMPMDLHPLHESLFGSGGLAGGGWDVAFVSTDWIAEAAAQRALLDLSPRLAADPPAAYPSAWTDSLLRFQSVEGAVLGLPYHDGPECLIYRTDLFDDPAEQAAYKRSTGSDLRLPQTWDEFRRVARHFHRPQNHLYGTVFAAYPDGHNTVYDFCLQLWTRGGELFDSAGRMNLDTRAAAEALAFYRTILNDRAAVHPGAREFDSVKAGLAFAAGEVAVMVNWFGFAAMSETMAESKVKGRVGVGLVPHGGGPHVSLNSYWILGIGAGSQKKETAWKFLRHCCSPEMDKLLTLEGGIGCRKTTWRDDEVNSVIPFYHRLESLHDGARELPRLANWAELASVIDEMVLGAINTEASEHELIARAQAKVR
ncbi:MAG TPA: extracellular solute-binding protein [Bryobacteraceae bacterium]|nr:extracellular solute-binding protein [Bryobacteraceae bacterium]